MNAGRLEKRLRSTCLSNEGNNMTTSEKCEPASQMPNGVIHLDEHFCSHSVITSCLKQHSDQLERKALKSVSGGMKLATTAQQNHWWWHI